MPWFLGPSDHVQSDPTEPARLVQPVNTALQSDPSQKSDKPKSPCMAPRATSIKEQGFSEAVAARIEAPQRGSTRSVYEASGPFLQIGASLIRWTSGHPPPPCKVSCWLPYVPIEDRKLQPSTIDGYRSAIADKLVNSPFNISKDKISLVSWIVSIETDPKAGGESPPGTSHWSCTSWLRLRLNQSRGPPWSIWPSRRFSSWPLGRASAEVRFMLHAGILYTNMIGQRYPCIRYPAFFPRISWPKRVQTVWLQWIYQPWPPTLDRSLKSDRSLFLVRALRYYLDRTSGRIRRWFLSTLRKVSTRTSHLPLSPLGSSRLWSYVMSSLTRRPTLYIRLKPMMSGPLLLLRCSSRESP